MQAAASFASVVAASMSGILAAGRIVPLAIAAAFAGASILVALRARRDSNAASLLGAFAAAASAFTRAATRGLPAAFAPPAVLLHGIYPEAFAPALIWDLAITFPRVIRFTRFDVIARRAALGAWLGGGALFAVNVAAAHGLSAPPLPMLMRDDAGNLFWHLFVVALVPAVAVIFVRARRAPASERRRVERFATAIGLGTGPLLLAGLARMALPPFDAWMLQSAGWGRGAIDAIILGSLMATPIGCTLAILKDRPFDLTPGSGWRETLAAIASILPPRAVAAGCARREQRLAAAVDRVVRARGPLELIALLERDVKDATGATIAHVLLPARARETLEDPFGRVDALSTHSALVTMLAGAAGQPFDVTDRACSSLLPPADLDWIRRHGAVMMAAIDGADAGIAGIVIVGAKVVSGGAFDRTDCRFLQILTAVAAGLMSAAQWREPSRSIARGTDASVEDPGNLAHECHECGAMAPTRFLPCGCGAPSRLAGLPMRFEERFELVRRLGAGAVGIVYLAHDRLLGRDVALKTIPALRGRAAARLAEEARAMARLNHAGIATLFDLRWWRGTPVLVTEYFPDGTLADLLRNGPLPCHAVVALGVSIAWTLEYMHGHGVLHGDIKPTNIAMTGAGSPKLLDLGLAAAMDRDAQDGRARPRLRWAGTKAYLPPEAFRGASRGPAFDLWGLSIVLAEGLTDVPRDRTGSLRSRISSDDAHRALGRFFERALAIDPRRRFGSAPELAAALLTHGEPRSTLNVPP